MCASSSSLPGPETGVTPRVERSLLRTSLALLAATIFAGCGGGGGGGGGGSSTPTEPPTLVSAAFLGTGAPSVGDRLVLFFSDDVMLTGAVLDASDADVSSGTLGSLTAAPAHLVLGTTLSNSVVVTLGSTSSFTVGSSAIALSAGNDAIADGSGTPLPATSMKVIRTGDNNVPTIPQLTLNDIDALLNGTGPAGGTLQVPRSGFEIDIGFDDATSAIDAAATVVTADVAVATANGTVAAGADLTGALQLATLSPTQAGTLRLTVPATTVFPGGRVTLTTTVTDAAGMTSQPATFPFIATAATAAIRPFDRHQTWFVDFSRDLESYTYLCDPLQPFNPVQVVAGANGTPDLQDTMAMVGLVGSDPAVNAVVMSRLQQEILDDLADHYPGIDVDFVQTAPGSFPAGKSSASFSEVSFSQICIGGAADVAGTSGILGIAIFDGNNDTQNDDCNTAFGSMKIRLGVFAHTLVNQGLTSAASSQFGTTFFQFVPNARCNGAPAGNPVGSLADDDLRVNHQLIPPDTRTMDIDTAISDMARALATITAHECGHSLGLVADGPMPKGLYGGDAHFPCPGGILSSGHLCMPDSVFPSLSQNVMSPALSYEGAIDPGTAFDSLNLSYLRETALYDDQ